MKKTKLPSIALVVLFVAQSIFAATFQDSSIVQRAPVVNFGKYIKSLKTFFLSYYLESEQLDQFKEIKEFFDRPLDKGFESLQLPFLYALKTFQPSESCTAERDVYNYMVDMDEVEDPGALLFPQEVLEVLYLGIMLEFIIREITSPISHETRFTKFIKVIESKIQKSQSPERAEYFEKIISCAKVLVTKKDEFYK